MVHSCDFCEIELDLNDEVVMVLRGRFGISPRSGNPTFLEDADRPEYYHVECLAEKVLCEADGDALERIREQIRDELLEEMLG